MESEHSKSEDLVYNLKSKLSQVVNMIFEDGNHKTYDKIEKILHN